MGAPAKLLLCLLAVTMTACAQLPRGAALQREIVATGSQETPDIAVYPITRAFLPTLATWPTRASTPHNWLGASKGSDAQIIRPGDMLNLTLWDSGENSLLTGTDQRATALTGLRVSVRYSCRMWASSRCQGAHQMPPAPSFNANSKKARRPFKSNC
jgi:hypothetical protein